MPRPKSRNATSKTITTTKKQPKSFVDLSVTDKETGTDRGSIMSNLLKRNMSPSTTYQVPKNPYINAALVK